LSPQVTTLQPADGDEAADELARLKAAGKRQGC
jgi:hypothetical protein